MAMQEHLRIKERHHCSITALGYHSARRECLTGFEDGVIKWWDMESGHMTLCTKEHAGWVTHFLSWIQARLLFSASNDSSVLVWAPGGTVLDRILLGYPIFTLAISLARHLLLCGSKGRLMVFPLDEKRESGHIVNITQSFSEWTHKDIVSCITCLDNHIYTAGYDKKLLIFDTYQTSGRKGLTKKQCISRAHNAAITHLILVRQQETTRVLSGSFDQTVGIWSQDGKLIQRLGPFISNITGLCYVAPIGVIWIANGTSQPTLYEPQSGEIVSQFISTFQGNQKDELVLQQLLSLPDSKHVIGIAKPQQVVIWRYSELGCLTLLPCKHSLECLAYAKKEPILLFSGDTNGMLQKWERSYISPFIYRESFHIDKGHLERRGPLADQIEKGHQKELEPCPYSAQKMRTCSRLRSCYSRSLITAKDIGKEKIGFTRVIFVEQLDILVMSAINGNIYLWEFETFIPGTEPPAQQNMSALDQESKTLAKGCAQSEMVCEPSSSCISDLTCRIVLCGHTGMITALTLVTNEMNGIHIPYLLSGGWDGRLCLWNLQKRSFQNTFSNLPGDNEPILDVACSQNSLYPPAPERREFAFSTSTGVFICAFNFHCADLELLAELCEHKTTVLALAWHPQQNKWVTGAEDGTIQLWSEDGGCCVRDMKAPRRITCICIDQINGCIIAGDHDTIRIYDPNSGALVQSYTGHQDSIKGLIHVPEMKQYVSVSLDGTARIWKAYHQGG
ncbi:uncharacterized protein LOC120304029 isoform X2 [Crotalus tigris]|uniref:uncharacterized protein LOC120304029 isoform X2 n=1 Tax=Crotalus tigris TaxID=88082 RepID=UPI00192F4A9F|nr:uncharacterized protein LOC120304029 isoform X2 [Crotalus tigris]